MKFRDLGLRTKIVGFAIFPLIMATILGLVTIVNVLKIRRDLNQSFATAVVIQRALDVERSAAETRATMGRYLLTGDRTFLDLYQKQIQAIHEDFVAIEKTLEPDPDKAKLLRKAQQAYKDWSEQVAGPAIEGRQESTSKDSLKASLFPNQDDGSFDRFNKLMAEFRNQEQPLMEASRGQASDRAGRSVAIFSVGLVLMIAFGLAFPRLIASTVTGPLDEAVRMAEAINPGDPSADPKIDRKDEVQRLVLAVKAIVESLNRQRSRVRDGVAITNELMASVSQLSASIQTTSAALQQTISAIEEVKQGAIFTGEKAKDIQERTLKVVSVADSGRQATEESIGKIDTIRAQMESIGETVATLSEHSHEIENIMETVQDLADQSNLLAVNAAIEASRAGEQGKAFAVVAQEIKNLADQSKAAAQQVRTILDDTQKWVKAVVVATEEGGRAVESGVEQSMSAASSIRKLGRSVQAGAEAATVISQSSDQQTQGIDQISDAMLNIEEAMQQSVEATSNVEEAASKMVDLGKDLTRIVRRYRV
jgi:methyl-accepting chemotaxis protein